MKASHVLLVTTVAIVTVWGCTKDEPQQVATPTPTPSTGSDFSALFANNIANATQTFSMSAGNGGMVMGASGTQLLFEPGAFVHADGTPVTGQVNVSLVEALTIGDMIMLNKQTVGDDNGTLRVLVSGGAINVYASQGGNTVRITESGLIARVPTDVGDPAMELFTGSEDAQGNIIWDRIDSSGITVDPAYYDSTDYTYTFPYYFNYNLSSPNFNWINCDYFYNSSNLTTVGATIPAGQSMDSTRVWIAMPSINGVMAMNGYAPVTPQTYEAWQSIPVGMNAVIIGLKQEAIGYSSSFSPITVTDDIVVPMTFTPTTLAEFEAAVNAL